MKNQLKTFTLLAMLMVALISCSSSKKDNFKLLIQTTSAGIEMKSIAGSAWKELAFDVPYQKPVLINQFGMAMKEEDLNTEDDQFYNYLFTIQRLDNGVILKGIEGTAWTSLEFSLHSDQQQAIDKFGMTSVN